MENDFLQGVTLPRTFVVMSQQDEVRAASDGGSPTTGTRTCRCSNGDRCWSTRAGRAVVAGAVVRSRRCRRGPTTSWPTRSRGRARSVSPLGSGMALAAPTILEHGPDALRRAPAAADPHRRGDVVPAVQRARQRLRPRRADDAGRARRRRVGRQRSEGVEHERAPRRPRHAPRPHRLGRAQAPGLTYFALPMHQAGVEVRPLRQMNGQRRSTRCSSPTLGSRVDRWSVNPARVGRSR